MNAITGFYVPLSWCCQKESVALTNLLAQIVVCGSQKSVRELGFVLDWDLVSTKNVRCPTCADLDVVQRFQ
jgi:hypothetical protein